LVITKGAVEVLLDKIDERQSYLFLHLNETKQPTKAIGLLACHKRNASATGTLNVEVIESSLTFIGFAGMIDRQGAKQKKAVSACIQANIL
jgi:Ca2+-transporting ATPase